MGSTERAATTLPAMIDAMEQAGTTDLRAHVDLPLALRIIGRPAGASLRSAADQLRAWRRAGGQRKDSNGDKVYEHSAAIRLMDAWWPRWVRAQFRPALGAKAFKAIEAAVQLDNEPNNHGDHLGSAYQTGWYGYVRKDLRTTLKRKVRGRSRACTAASCGAAGRCCGARCAPRSPPPAATSTAATRCARTRSAPATSGASTRSASARWAAPRSG